MPSFSATCFTIVHAAVEVGVEREDDRAVRDRLDQLGERDLAAGRNTTAGIAAAAA